MSSSLTEGSPGASQRKARVIQMVSAYYVECGRFAYCGQYLRLLVKQQLRTEKNAWIERWSFLYGRKVSHEMKFIVWLSDSGTHATRLQSVRTSSWGYEGRPDAVNVWSITTIDPTKMDDVDFPQTDAVGRSVRPHSGQAQLDFEGENLVEAIFKNSLVVGAPGICSRPSSSASHWWPERQVDVTAATIESIPQLMCHSSRVCATTSQWST